MAEYIGPLAATGALAVTLLKELGVFDNIKDKLKEKKGGDPAFSQISTALYKMMDFYSIMNNSLKVLKELSVHDDDSANKTKNVLQERVISGQLDSELRDGRLRCGEIESIWNGDPRKNIPSLHNWFLSLERDGTISESQYLNVENFFLRMSDSDEDLLDIIKKINESALDYARRITSLIDSNDIQNAQIETEKMINDIKNFQSPLSEASGQLQRAGDEFVKIAKDYAPSKTR